MGVVRFKDGVTLLPTSATARLLGVLDTLARASDDDLTVTCGSDGHPETDPHTRGKAVDIRVHGQTHDEISALLRAIVVGLNGSEEGLTILPTVSLEHWATPLWFGQWEAPGQPNEHLHIQVRRGLPFP